MQLAPVFPDDEDRVAALHQRAILDTPPEERFDHITRSATELLGAPISTISLIDHGREWYKSRCGIEMSEGRRSVSFCGHALYSPRVFVVEDTLQDARFVDNPYVVGSPYIRAYIGVSLYDQRTKFPIGVFCAKDTRPRKFTPTDIRAFMKLATAAEDELNRDSSAAAKK